MDDVFSPGYSLCVSTWPFQFKAHSCVQLMKSKEMINTFGAGGQKFLLAGWAGIWDFSLQVCRQPTFYMYLMIVHFASKLCLEEMFKSVVSLDDVIS